jgi:hypothetical protein
LVGTIFAASRSGDRRPNYLFQKLTRGWLLCALTRASVSSSDAWGCSSSGIA